MALLREVDPGEVGRADRVKPLSRRPPKAILFHGDGRSEPVAIPGCTARLAEPRTFFFADLHVPNESELEILQKEFQFHPLAIEDVRTRHQRPKIDIYGDRYFLVFYRVGPGPGPNGDWLLQEIDFFIGPNFLIVTHDSEVPLLDAVFDRFLRSTGRKGVATLLYEILDAIVDQYFEFLDDFGERSDALEERIFEGSYDRANLKELHELKTELALLRRVVSPGRDAVNVLLRRDPPILDQADIFYFQDVYDHLIRVSDSIDTYRELATVTIDAFLSVQNNQLAEVVKKLTVISIIFLPLNFITGFWGMNFALTTGKPHHWFVITLAVMAAIPFVMFTYLRRKGLR